MERKDKEKIQQYFEMAKKELFSITFSGYLKPVFKVLNLHLTQANTKKLPDHLISNSEAEKILETEDTRELLRKAINKTKLKSQELHGQLIEQLNNRAFSNLQKGLDRLENLYAENGNESKDLQAINDIRDFIENYGKQKIDVNKANTLYLKTKKSLKAINIMSKLWYFKNNLLKILYIISYSIHTLILIVGKLNNNYTPKNVNIIICKSDKFLKIILKYKNSYPYKFSESKLCQDLEEKLSSFSYSKKSTNGYSIFYIFPLPYQSLDKLSNNIYKFLQHRMKDTGTHYQDFKTNEITNEITNKAIKPTTKKRKSKTKNKRRSKHKN